MDSQNWYDVLLTPWLVAPHPNEPTKSVSPKQAVAMLIEGRFLEYNRYAEADESLPELERLIDDPRDPTALTLNSLVRLVTGEGDAASGFFEVIKTRAALPLKVAAAILGSVAASDQGDHAWALETLGRLLEFAERRDPLATVLLLMQKSLREAEVGAWHSAIQAAESALELESLLPDEPTASILQIARLNLWMFKSNITFSPGKFPGIERRTLPSALARPAQKEAGALHSYIKRRFSEIVEDPYGQSTTWYASDEVEVALWTSLMLSEVKGDFASTRSTRFTLARYRVLETVEGGQQVEVKEPLQMLLRSGNEKAIRAASSTFMRKGPLAPLQEVTRSAVSEEWTAANSKAFIALLRETGDLLGPGDRSQTISRLLSLAASATSASPESRLMRLMGHEPYEAISQLVRLADRRTQELVAAELLVIDVQGDPIVSKSVSWVLHNLDWKGISDDLRRHWLDAAIGRLAGQTLDDQPLTVLQRLAATNDSGAAQALLDLFETRPTLEVAAAIVDAGIDVPQGTVRAIRDLTLAKLAAIASSAERGAFSFGGVSAPLLLAVLLLRWGHKAAWQRLTSFLLNSNVAYDDKEAALDVLARATRLPQEVKKRVKRSGKTLLRSENHSFFGRPRPNAAVLRLLLSIQGIESIDALASLSDLLASSDPVRRIEGGKTLWFARQALSPDLITTMVINLSRDPDTLVRANVAPIVAQLSTTADQALRPLLEERLLTFLQDSGTSIPLAALHGIEASETEVGPTVMKAVRELRGHPSYRIRNSVSVILKEPVAEDLTPSSS